MTEEMARSEMPKWSKNAIRIVDEDDGPVLDRQWKHERPGQRRKIDWERMVKRYGIVVAGAAMFTLYTIVLSWCVHAGAVKQVRADMEVEYAARLEEYKAEQARAVQAEHWLSGTASLDAAVNQAVDAVAPVIAKLNTDQQKLTEACCMLARVMSKYYPNNFEEVAEQPSQWMFYDGTNKTCTDHDRELAEQIIRPYMTNGTVPNGLTDMMVYGEWSQNDFVLRDSYKTTSTMHTFRFVP